MLLADLFEMVIDASDKFKGKTTDDFKKKLDSLAAELPDRFAKQEQLEKFVKDSLEELRVELGKAFNSHRLELAPLLKHYRKDVTIPEVLSFADRSDEDYDLAVSFVKKHSEKLLTALKDYKEKLNALKTWADEQNWPTGKGSATRYTHLGIARSEADTYISTIEKLRKAGSTS